ncbi:MAG: T9SS type A sorting domain-containing protein [Bacteroidota bacterium]|nr:T9SS type A sorting domain-containing protein [Bacteroidota bacterium]
MKKTFFLFIFFSVSIALCSFYYLSKKDFSQNNSSRDIVLQFVTYNGYGNNLYIDNVLTGIQPESDVAVTSILNIPYDTIYSTQKSGTDTISPVVTVVNIGRNTVDTVNIFLQIEPGKYLDFDTILPLAAGQAVTVMFDVFTYSIGTGYYFKAYTSYSADSNRTNDTLNQYSISLPGFTRNVLYEEFTSNSSPACANNNSFLNNFVNTNIQSVNAIMYHTGTIGLDSFYLQNPQQQDARRNYYYVTSVPTTFADGKLPVSIPYGDSANLYSPYFKRLSVGTPVSMNVTDEIVSGDSMKTTIDLNIISFIQPGNYKLRINAIERRITRPNQGTNGETDFFDVFRAFYPDSNGIQIPTAIGNYQYQYTYYLNPLWADSMIYTSAFIQNDNTREIINSAKGSNISFKNIVNSSKVISKKSDLLNVSYDYRGHFVNNNFSDSIQTSLNIELFEAFFPPLGWIIFNQDGFITFQQYNGANGPTFGGTKSVLMNFFDYNIPGQRDSMYSKVYSGLLVSDTLRFDYAYAQYATTENIDSLTVNVSTDGGLTFPIEIFRKGGLALSTAPQTTSFFVPTNSTQWKSLKFTLDSIVSVGNSSTNIPSGFSLNQNYPNPFNPLTIISYVLPVSNYVNLKVYDMLGKEIKKLVDKKQSAGKYEISFDATNLPSGIYFYQFNSEGFTDTKRMVLIK